MLCWLVELTHAWILSPCLAFPGPGEFLILQMFQLFAYVTCLQCCRAKPFFLGSSSRYFFLASAPPIKARLRLAPSPKNRFLYKTFEKSKF